MRRVAWKHPMFLDMEVTRSRLPLASLDSEEDSSIQSVVAVEQEEEGDEEEVSPPLLEWNGEEDEMGEGLRENRPGERAGITVVAEMR